MIHKTGDQTVLNTHVRSGFRDRMAASLSSIFITGWTSTVLSLLLGTPGAWALGPSFDCTTAQTPVQQLICSSPDLSRTDLEYARAYYAVRQQLGEAGWQALKLETIAREKQMLQRCGVPLSGPLPPNPANLAQCLEDAYRAQRVAWLMQMSEPGQEETQRPLEQHIALQRQLQVLSFLPSDAVIDGIYGTATRNAIVAWQHQKGRPETGFISNADADLLMQSATSTQVAGTPTPTITGPVSKEPIIAQWSGMTDMVTRPFRINGPWELQWTCSSGFFSIEPNRRDGREQHIALQSQGGSSSSYVPDSGEFYLKIVATGDWTIKAVSLTSASQPQVDFRTGGGGAPSPAVPAVVGQKKSSSEMPDSEAAVIQIVNAAIDQYKAGGNEMQQGAARPMRAQSLCHFLPDRYAREWVGTITKLSTNGEGRGVLYVQIMPNILIETQNNEFSDGDDNTLIDPHSNLFRTLSQLHEGQKIVFTGRFISSPTDCFEEKSLTMNGSITQPEFVMRFESVDPIAASSGRDLEQSSGRGFRTWFALNQDKLTCEPVRETTSGLANSPQEFYSAIRQHGGNTSVQTHRTSDGGTVLLWTISTSLGQMLSSYWFDRKELCDSFLEFEKQKGAIPDWNQLN